jgi:uncharacterized membrane protein YtjA (UPF0391 family)
MFAWAIGFFLIAVVAAVLGFVGVAALVAKIIFVVAALLAIISYITGRAVDRVSGVIGLGTPTWTRRRLKGMTSP